MGLPTPRSGQSEACQILLAVILVAEAVVVVASLDALDSAHDDLGSPGYCRGLSVWSACPWSGRGWWRAGSDVFESRVEDIAVAEFETEVFADELVVRLSSSPVGEGVCFFEGELAA